MDDRHTNNTDEFFWQVEVKVNKYIIINVHVMLMSTNFWLSEYMYLSDSLSVNLE